MTIKLLKGDAFEEMAKLPDESVNLILTDPPYGTIKGLKHFRDSTDWDVRLDTDRLLAEFSRLLKPHGAAIIFSNNSYTQELRAGSTGILTYHYPLYWLKDTAGNALYAKKAPLSTVEDLSVFHKGQGFKAEELRAYSRQVTEYIGKTLRQVQKELNTRKAEHFLSAGNPTYSQPGIPTRETYKLLVETYELQDMPGFLEYEELVKLKNKEMPDQTFNLFDGNRFISNVLEYDKPKGSTRDHPTQKPVDLLEFLIRTYSNPGDVVLDSTMGTGSTGLATLKAGEGRNFIGIEISDKYFNLASTKITNQFKSCQLLTK